MREVLNPCPFCGYGGGVVKEADSAEFGGYHGFYAYCPQCFSRGPVKFQSYHSAEFARDEAAEAWNKWLKNAHAASSATGRG